MKPTELKCALILALVPIGVPVSAQTQPQKKLSSEELDRAVVMLHELEADAKKNYYDPSFHGVSLDQQFRQTEERVQSAVSFNQALVLIASALDELNDSHTFFFPPRRPYRHSYGWEMKMIGNRCYVTAVRPNTDAEAKGLRPGDEILAIKGFQPTRENLWKIHYLFDVLSPRQFLPLVVRSPGGTERTLEIEAKITPRKLVVDIASLESDFWNFIRELQSEDRLLRTECKEWGDELETCKMRAFNLTDSKVDELIGGARGRKTLILDLRGNPGGSVETLKHVIGRVFDHEVKIADRVGRKEHKPEVAKSAGGRAFTGKLIVLVDSKSASAAEVFSRVVQLEKRGVVIGDQTAGAVMEARQYSHQIGTYNKIYYGDEVTAADLIMVDGKSLEKVGVTPDELLLPAPEDLRGGRDPVLAHAAALAGVKLTPEQANKLFPLEWMPD